MFFEYLCNIAQSNKHKYLYYKILYILFVINTCIITHEWLREKTTGEGIQGIHFKAFWNAGKV